MQSDLFMLLKTVLKARGITYGALGKRLNLSEVTIKRIFADQDCKLSRLTDICGALDLTIDDLVAEAKRIEVRPFQLGDQIERRLAEDRAAFHFFLLLLDDMTPDAIQAQYNLEDTTLFILGRRLEKMGLLEVMPGNRIRLLVKGPVHFRRDGPLHQTLLKLNMDFLHSTYLQQDTDHSVFMTQTRRISEKTARHVLGRIRELQMELSDLARKDQLTQPETALGSYKLAVALSPINFHQLLELDLK